MSHYRANRRDLEFLLFDVLERPKAWQDTSDVDRETAQTILEHAERWAIDRLSPSFAAAREDPVRFDAATGAVTLPADIRRAIEDHLRADWLALEDGSPASLRWAATEFFIGANPAVIMCTNLIPVAVRLLRQQGTPWQRRIADLIVERHWTVTMTLTEDEAGSDVGALRTAAALQADGSWHLEGTKRFITFGEHDAAENIVHLVLARPKGATCAGDPGTRGLSLFIVPKYLFDEDGTLGARNGVVATHIEKKMGVAATPTCGMAFGEATPAVGWLLGDRHDGIRQMFEIIRYVRMMVGVKATATLSTGYRQALEFAFERVQGRHIAARPDDHASVRIVEHPDVRRSLLTQKAHVEGMRALCLYAATLIEDGADDRLALLLPVVKGYCSETGYRLLGSESLQVLGGSGFLADYPLEQYVRDTKIDTIYEGTTGIQALDLFTRRIHRDRGAVFRSLLDDLRRLGGDRFPQETALLHDAIEHVDALAGHIAAGWAETPAIAALNCNRLLACLGDVTCGALLLRSAAVAAERLAQGQADTDGAYYRGKIESARWFARQTLPRIAAELAAARLVDGGLLDVPDSALF